MYIPLGVPQDERQPLDGGGCCDGYEAWSSDDTHLVAGTVCHGLTVY